MDRLQLFWLRRLHGRLRVRSLGGRQGRGQRAGSALAQIGGRGATDTLLGSLARLDDVEWADLGRCDGEQAENPLGCVRQFVPILASSGSPLLSAAGSSLACAEAELATLRERRRHATMSKVSFSVVHPFLSLRALAHPGSRSACRGPRAVPHSIERAAILAAAGVVTRVGHDRGGTVLRSRSGIWRSRVCPQASWSLRLELSSGRGASELCADNIAGSLMCQTSRSKLQRSKRYYSIE